MKTSIRNLQPFIQKIMEAPLPTNCGLEFYLDIESIRCQAVTQMCADLLKRLPVQSADAGLRQELRQALDPIRRDLLAKYPDCEALLDPDTWPENRWQS